MDGIWLVVLLVLGFSMLFKPEVLWKIENIFSVKNGEPTDLYLALMRIGGIFFIGASMIVFIVNCSLSGTSFRSSTKGGS